MHFFHILLMLCAAIVSADESSSVSDSFSTSFVKTTTLVWATGTDSLGSLQTTQSAYTQTFPVFYKVVSSVPAGSINLGSVSGTVGSIREYTHTTVNGAKGTPTTNVVVKVFPFISALLGLLWL